ncbi:MAG: DciA family protein [Acidimicrobiales bacterium]
MSKSPGRDGPRRLGESLEQVVRAIGPQSASEFGALFGRWEEIVGDAVAAHARPLRVTPSTLLIAVDQPAWATQVRAIAPSVLARIVEVVGAAPDHLEVVVRPR